MSISCLRQRVTHCDGQDLRKRWSCDPYSVVGRGRSSHPHRSDPYPPWHVWLHFGHPSPTLGSLAFVVCRFGLYEGERIVRDERSWSRGWVRCMSPVCGQPSPEGPETGAILPTRHAHGHHATVEPGTCLVQFARYFALVAILLGRHENRIRVQQDVFKIFKYMFYDAFCVINARFFCRR